MCFPERFYTPSVQFTSALRDDARWLRRRAPRRLALVERLGCAAAVAGAARLELKLNDDWDRRRRAAVGGAGRAQPCSAALGRRPRGATARAPMQRFLKRAGGGPAAGAAAAKRRAPSLPVDCPLCGRAVLASVAQAHVEDCAAAAAAASARAATAAAAAPLAEEAARSQASEAGPPHAERIHGLPSQASQPELVIQVSQASHTTPPAQASEQHAVLATPLSMPAPGPAPTPAPAQAPPAPVLTPGPTPGPAAPSTQLRSALGLLMRAAKVQRRREVFACTGASLTLSWRRAEPGVSEPVRAAWTATVDLFNGRKFASPGDDPEAYFVGSRVLLVSSIGSLRDEAGFARALGQAAVSFHPLWGPLLEPHASRWRQGEPATALTVGVLKSLLQKSVRRRLPLGALFATCELLQRKRMEALRRLPIVAVEDSLLHGEQDLIVWLMLACDKGFIPSVPHLRRVLLIVAQVASSSCADVIGDGALAGASGAGAAAAAGAASTFSDGDGDSAAPAAASLAEGAALAQAQAQLLTAVDARAEALADGKCAALLRSLLCRATFGGMAGDIRLLLLHADAWSERFSAAAANRAATAAAAALAASVAGTGTAGTGTAETGTGETGTAETGMAGTAGATSPCNAWLGALNAFHLKCAEEKAAEERPGQLVTLPTAGVDHHCAPWMLGKLGAASPDELSEAMWVFHSSCNARHWLGEPGAAPLLAGMLTAHRAVKAREYAREQQALRRDAEQQHCALWKTISGQVGEIAVSFLRAKCPLGTVSFI